MQMNSKDKLMKRECSENRSDRREGYWTKRTNRGFMQSLICSMRRKGEKLNRKEGVHLNSQILTIDPQLIQAPQLMGLNLKL